MDIEQYFEKQRLCINEKLKEFFTPKSSDNAALLKAAIYSINTPGKRLRPIFTLAASSMLGGSEQAALIPACAIEMIHTYSMIHDDLPCMDNDDFRRGMPTLHKAFEESTAVLTGDFLLTYAFQILADAPDLPYKSKLELISLFAKSSGGCGMIGGQVMDLESENKEISYETLEEIHLKKTAILIAASIESGAIVSNADSFCRLKLEKFGILVGLAFQIIDDILDVTESETKHGSKISSDTSNKKATAVSLLGIEKALQKAQVLTEKAFLLLDTLPFDTTLLRKIAEYVISRNR